MALSELITILKRLEKVTDSSLHTLSESFHFKDGFVYAVNSRMSARFPLPADCIKDNFSVNGKEFLKILQLYKDSTITVGDNKVTVKGKGKASLPLFTDEFNPDEYMPDEVALNPVTSQFSEGMTFVRPAALDRAISESQAICQFIRLRSNAIEAGNQASIALFAVDLPIPSDSIVHVKATDYFGVICGKVDSIASDENRFYLLDDLGGFYTFNAAQVTNPRNLKGLVDSFRNSPELEFSPEIDEVLNELCALYDGVVNPSISLTANEAVFSYTTPMLQYERGIGVTYSGRPIKVTLNPKLLKQAFLSNVCTLAENGAFCFVDDVRTFVMSSKPEVLKDEK